MLQTYRRWNVLRVMTLAVVAVLAVPTSAERFQATPQHFLSDSGNAFLQQCKHVGDSDGRYVYDNAVCLYYLGGFIEGTIAADELRGVSESQRTFCPPDNATQEQAVRIVLKAIEEHPEMAHHATRRLAGAALVKAFPCK